MSPPQIQPPGPIQPAQSFSCTVRLSNSRARTQLQPRRGGQAMTAMAHFEIEPVINRVCGHGSDRLARQELVVWLYCHASQSRQDRIVASGDLQDQDLTILMVRAGIK